MFCTKYKEQIKILEEENKTLKAKVVKGQETVNKTNAYYKAKIAEIRSSKPNPRRKNSGSGSTI